MNTQTESINHYLTQYANLKSQLPGFQIPWVQMLRHTACGYFEKSGFPTRHDEDWKYTSVTEISKEKYPIHFQSHSLETQTLKPFYIPNLDCFRLIFIDGIFSKKFSDFNNFPKNVAVHSIKELLEKNPEKIKSHLNSPQTSYDNGFSALNITFLTDGYFLEIPENYRLEKPLHVIFLTVQQKANHIHNIVETKSNSQLILLESFVGLGEESYLTNVTTQLYLGENSQIEYHKIQQENKQGQHIGITTIQQQRDSQLTSYSFSLGGKLVRSDIHAHLTSENTKCTLYGLYMANQQQHIDHHTRIDHLKPRSSSYELYKGIINDRAHAVFNGKIVVAADAQKTAAEQRNQNILLSKSAAIDTKPQLEIFANDVKCTHSATIGQLDENALFYLQSRGLLKKEAQHLLINAFSSEITDKITLPAVKQYLEQLLTDCLQQPTVTKVTA